jgi:hypothetical protein
MTRWSFVDSAGSEFFITTAAGLQALLSANTITQAQYDESIIYAMPEFIAESFKRLNDDLEVEVDLVERSNNAGAEAPGLQRDASGEIVFQYDCNGTESAWRGYVNRIVQKARNAKYLRDYVNGYQTEVQMSNHNVAWDSGGYNQGAVNSLSFRQLVPYWEDINYTTVTDSALTAESFSLSVLGYVETPPLITLVAADAVTKILIKIEENGRGIYIDENQFGTLGLTVMIIDCADGTVELSGINRNQTVRPGTGWFNLQPGVNTMTIETDNTVATTIQWRERYYL